jgi:hypothetical protein
VVIVVVVVVVVVGSPGRIDLHQRQCIEKALMMIMIMIMIMMMMVIMNTVGVVGSPGRIDMHQRQCIEKALQTSVQLLVLLLEQEQEVYLPTLCLLFNKKKTLYKGKRRCPMASGESHTLHVYILYVSHRRVAPSNESPTQPPSLPLPVR